MRASPQRRRVAAAGLVVAAVLSLAPNALQPAGAQQSRSKDCSATSVGLVPLTDLGAGDYMGRSGGLYRDGNNDMPPGHLARGLEIAQQVVPRDADGLASEDGLVGFVAIGVSNTRQEFDAFMKLARGDDRMHPAIELVNGAQGGQTVTRWLSPNSETYTRVDVQLDRSEVSREQVQVAWVKLPDARMAGQFPANAEMYADNLAVVLGLLKDRYPNLALAYLSSRIYAGYGDRLDPEPFAYEGGFGVKWTIEQQLDGDLEAGEDAPWIAWGPYLWADGVGPDGEPGGAPGRGDGLEWTCDDLAQDGIHPSDQGAEKVAGLLWEFLISDATAQQWFLADPPPPPTVTTTSATTTTTTTTTTAAPSSTTSPPATSTTVAAAPDDDGSGDVLPVAVGAAAGALVVGLGAGYLLARRRRFEGEAPRA